MLAALLHAARTLQHGGCGSDQRRKKRASVGAAAAVQLAARSTQDAGWRVSAAIGGRGAAGRTPHARMPQLRLP
jgi:hypothetical protein